MRNPFNFEAEPFEFESEFDEYEEGQPNPYSEFDEGELYDEYSDTESFEVYKPRICKAGLDDLVELKNRIDYLKSIWEDGDLDNIEYRSKSVIEQGNLIKARLKNGWYKRKGCTAKDLESIKKLKTTR